MLMQPPKDIPLLHHPKAYRRRTISCCVVCIETPCTTRVVSTAQADLCGHSLQVLAAFLKAIGCIIPLMDATYAEYYTKEVMLVLVREFQTPDEEMKKIVLKVVKQCVETEGVQPDYVRREILPEFFRSFWVRRMALDRRNYRALVETTVALSNKVSAVGGLRFV